MEDRVSKHFKFSEFSKSDTANRHHINTAITDWEVRDNIIALVDNVLEPLREAWGGPLFINSGYRCKELNELVGGVETSQHRRGQAADVGVTDPYALAKLVQRMGLVYDQMGIYASFVHLSYNNDGENRKQVFYGKNWKGPKL